MSQAIKSYSSLAEVVGTGRAFLRFWLRQWWQICLMALIGALLGFFYFKKQKPRYEAVTTFILEEKSSGNGLAGLASQIGLNLGNMNSGGGIFAGDNILDILKSKTVVQSVLLSKVDSNSSSMETLADNYLQFSGMKKKWSENTLLSNIRFSSLKESMTPLQDSILGVIYDHLVEKSIATDRIAEMGTIIKVQVTATDGKFARLLAERLVHEASRLYLEIRTGTAQENIRQMQRRSDSLLAMLNNRSYRAAASQPIDLNPGLRTATVPMEIATRDKTVLATLYAEVTKNLEASKLLLSQQTPVIQMLDRPDMLLDDNKKSMFALLVLFAIGSFFIHLMFSVVRFLFSSVSIKE